MIMKMLQRQKLNSDLTEIGDKNLRSEQTMAKKEWMTNEILQ